MSRQQFASWVPVVLWMALTSYLATDAFSGASSRFVLWFWVGLLHLPLNVQDVELANTILRKAAHMFEFFVLGFLLYRTLSLYPHSIQRRVPVWVLLAGGMWAVFNEGQQAFTVTRGPSVLDVGWDFAGVLCSQVVYWLHRPKAGVAPSPEPGRSPDFRPLP